MCREGDNAIIEEYKAVLENCLSKQTNGNEQRAEGWKRVYLDSLQKLQTDMQSRQTEVSGIRKRALEDMEECVSDPLERVPYAIDTRPISEQRSE